MKHTHGLLTQHAKFTGSSAILDFESPSIAKLISDRAWESLDTFEQIGAAYQFVKDEIQFGYSRSDDMPASEILSDAYGQCNTKGIVFMVLLRALNIPCRLHGFTIEQSLQKGAIPPLILHSWFEVYFDLRWVNLEGFILDARYLSAIQTRFSADTDTFCGYGVSTLCLSSPPVNWTGSDTYIQKRGYP